MTETVYAVLVTHRRPDELAKSLEALSAQSRTPDHIVVVDNDFPNDPDERVRDLVAGQPVATTYLGSRRNLGGAGGFALGMLHALALGADWLWLADDDGRPQDSGVLATLLMLPISTCAVAETPWLMAEVSAPSALPRAETISGLIAEDSDSNRLAIKLPPLDVLLKGVMSPEQSGRPEDQP